MIIKWAKAHPRQALLLAKAFTEAGVRLTDEEAEHFRDKIPPRKTKELP